MKHNWFSYSKLVRIQPRIAIPPRSSNEQHEDISVYHKIRIHIFSMFVFTLYNIKLRSVPARWCPGRLFAERIIEASNRQGTRGCSMQADALQFMFFVQIAYVKSESGIV